MTTKNGVFKFKISLGIPDEILMIKIYRDKMRDISRLNASI